MLKAKIFLVILLMSSAMKAQITDKQIGELVKMLNDRVNKLRTELQLTALQLDVNLSKAAEIQSKYMSKNRVLTHEQKAGNMKTLEKRVKSAADKRQYMLLGENILQSEPITEKLSKKELEALAETMFEQWQGSDDHYANMTDKNFDLTGVSVSYDPTKKVLYATQVFGKLQSTATATSAGGSYKLSRSDIDCDKLFKDMLNLISSMGNGVNIEDNQRIWFYHPDKDLVSRVLSGPRDGLAIDLLTRDQFACGGKNLLDASPVIDGVLLKPVFKNDLLAGNKAEGNYRLITTLGEIPENMANKELAASLLLIKNEKMCKYLVPGWVPAKEYELKKIDPVLTDPSGVSLRKEGIIAKEEVNYEFRTNEINPIKLPGIHNKGKEVHSIAISSYSSVEGTLQSNNRLHQGRAVSIRDHLQSQLKLKESQIKIEAGENWPGMYFQLSYFMREDLAEKPIDSLRKIVNNPDQSLAWDSLFFEQRRASAIIYYKGKLSEKANTAELLTMNLRTAIAEKNIPLINKALYKLYQEGSTDSSLLFENGVFDALTSYPEVVQNAAAVFAHYYKWNVFRTVEFLHHWILQADKLKPEARTNLLYLYSLTGYTLLDKWDVSSERLSNVVHPKRINRFETEKENADLLLNLKLTYLRYFGQINDVPKVSQMFDFVSEYFKKQKLSQDDMVNLALFYNAWSVYGGTIDLLLDRFKKNDINEDGLFILAATMSFYTYGVNQKDLTEVHKKAHKTNAKKWCEWVNADFQILRNDSVKQLYCQQCK